MDELFFFFVLLVSRIKINILVLPYLVMMFRAHRNVSKHDYSKIYNSSFPLLSVGSFTVNSARL